MTLLRTIIRWLRDSPRVSAIQPMGKGSLSARLMAVHMNGAQNKGALR